MKYRNAFLLFLICASIYGCTTTRVVPSKTVAHNYSNISFIPEKIKNSGFGKLDITITPIDAASINRETFAAASRDGNYEKEVASTMEKEKNELSRMSRAEKAFFTGKLNAIEAINRLEQENLIQSYSAYLLKMRILIGGEQGRDGSEIASLSDVESFPDNFNPFKINQKYLSVFKVVFENSGSEIEKIKLKEFQVLSGEELLYPFGIEYFENNLKNEPEKLKNAYRMNIPDELMITPGQKITKYISIPAINPKNKNLQIQAIRDKNILSFDFDVWEREENKIYSLKRYEFLASGVVNSPDLAIYYAILYPNGITYAMTDSHIFVEESKRNGIATVYAIAISRATSSVRLARKDGFKFSEATNYRIYVPFEKPKGK